MTFRRLPKFSVALCAIVQLILVAGCADSQRIAELEKQNKELESQLAERRNGVDSGREEGLTALPTAEVAERSDDSESSQIPTGFKGKIAKKYEDSVEYCCSRSFLKNWPILQNHCQKRS